MSNLLAMLFFQSNSAPGNSAAAQGVAMVAVILWAVVTLFFIAVGWKIFAKAGQPGWAVLVPIYNIIVAVKIMGKPGWWFILMIIPFVNIILAGLMFAKVFGKGTGFALGLIFLSPIFYPILAFGSARYTPAAA
jgi:hypothetical protein